MLWTDSFRWVTPADLMMIDPEIGEISQSEKTVLTGPTGSIAQGMTDAAIELTSTALQSYQSFIAPAGIPFNHMLAVQQTGAGSPYGNTYRVFMGQIVVSNDPSYYGTGAVKQFVIHMIMRRFYMAVASRKDPDRYRARWENINHEIERRIKPFLFNNGLPTCDHPLDCPGAEMVPVSGAWAAGTATLVGGTAQLVDVAITYTANGYSVMDPTSNAESGPGSIKAVTVADGKGLTVDIAGLNPPTGKQSLASRAVGMYQPLAASGWKIYVGRRGTGILYDQTPQPLPIATKTHAFTADPVFSGATLGTGQAPNTYFTISTTINRA